MMHTRRSAWNSQKTADLSFGFRKAFDCTPRKKLFNKRRTMGVKGRVLELFMSMYSNDKSAVKIENEITATK